jgi:hypothetical protein
MSIIVESGSELSAGSSLLPGYPQVVRIGTHVRRKVVCEYRQWNLEHGKNKDILRLLVCIIIHNKNKNVPSPIVLPCA